MNDIRLELPLPPSMNVYWRRGRAKGSGQVVTHLTHEGRAFRRHVKMLWLAQRKGRAPLEGPVSVDATLWFPTMASDVDNRIKPCLDALEHAGVFGNDRQVALVQFMRGGTVGRKNEGVMLVEVGSFEWRAETVAEFKRAAEWEI